jgi:hypothetical protein
MEIKGEKMEHFNPLSIPIVGYVRAALSMRFVRLRAARGAGERGASAIELAIITAILVGLAVGVVFVISGIVTTRKAQITSNNGGIP